MSLPAGVLGPGVVFGDCEIIGILETGALGSIFLARQLSLQRDVLLHVPSDAVATDPAAIAHFTRQARMAGQVNHPAVTPVYSVGTEDNVPFCVTGYWEGTSLDRLLTGQARLPEEKALSVLQCVAECAYAIWSTLGHGHGAISAEAVVLSPAGDVRLTNTPFLWSDDVPWPGPVGTTEKSSKPLSADQAPVPFQADVVALGRLLGQMLTGSDPGAVAPVKGKLTAFVRNKAPTTSKTTLRLLQTMLRPPSASAFRTPEHFLGELQSAVGDQTDAAGSEPAPQIEPDTLRTTAGATDGGETTVELRRAGEIPVLIAASAPASSGSASESEEPPTDVAPKNRKTARFLVVALFIPLLAVLAVVLFPRGDDSSLDALPDDGEPDPRLLALEEMMRNGAEDTQVLAAAAKTIADNADDLDFQEQVRARVSDLTEAEIRRLRQPADEASGNESDATTEEETAHTTDETEPEPGQDTDEFAENPVREPELAEPEATAAAALGGVWTDEMRSAREAATRACRDHDYGEARVQLAPVIASPDEQLSEWGEMLEACINDAERVYLSIHNSDVKLKGVKLTIPGSRKRWRVLRVSRLGVTVGKYAKRAGEETVTERKEIPLGDLSDRQMRDLYRASAAQDGPEAGNPQVGFLCYLLARASSLPACGSMFRGLGETSRVSFLRRELTRLQGMEVAGLKARLRALGPLQQGDRRARQQVVRVATYLRQYYPQHYRNLDRSLLEVIRGN